MDTWKVELAPFDKRQTLLNRLAGEGFEIFSIAQPAPGGKFMAIARRSRNRMTDKQP